MPVLERRASGCRWALARVCERKAESWVCAADESRERGPVGVCIGG